MASNKQADMGEAYKPELRMFQLNLNATEAQLVAMMFAAGPKPHIAELLVLSMLVDRLGEAGMDRLKNKMAALVGSIRDEDVMGGTHG